MKKLLLCLPFLILLFAACHPVTEHPQIERPLVFTEAYMDLYHQYQQVYGLAGEEKQQMMRREVAPLLNDAKHLIAGYNDLVLMGADPGPEQRQVILNYLREISVRLSEVQND